MSQSLINEFTSKVKSLGIARRNRYTVRVLPPLGIDTSRDNEVSRIVTLFCHQVDVPGMQIATFPSRVFGEVREMPYDRMFQPVRLSFYSDADLKIRGFFERWIHKVMNQTSRTLEYYDNYKGSIIIDIDTVEEKSAVSIAPYSIKLEEVYPKDLQMIDMGSNSNENILIEVLFQYRYWISSASSYSNSQSESPFVGNQDSQSIQTQTALTTNYKRPGQ